MRPITSSALHVLAATALIAFAATSAAAADIYLKLGDIKGESGRRILNPVPRDARQIAVDSFSWGATQAIYGHGTGGSMRAVMGSKIKDRPLTSGVRVATGDIDADGKAPAAGAKMSMQDTHLATDAAGPALASQGLAVSDPGASAVRVNKPDQLTTKREGLKMQSGGGTAQGVMGARVAAGDVDADGKRKRIDKASPLLARPRFAGQGSLAVSARFPGCTVGTRYHDAVLQTPDYKYELKEVLITNCAVSGPGGGGGETESVTLNYASYRESPTRASQK